ncbi:MAG: signal peptidase I [Candidatus Nezhaarchaeota archaeon]|nr:signal peptidase I [Candidatus Nezhaarchaeota archaeon]
MSTKSLSFLTRVSTIVFVLVSIVLVFSLLSRLGYLNFFGVAIVFSGSMEPTLSRGDLVLYANLDYSPGDIIVYCKTPSYAVVHRFVEVSPWNGEVIFTKGDANDVYDPPVHRGMVRGKVLLAVPWFLWAPLTALLIAFAIYDMLRSGAIGYSYAIAFTLALAYIFAVYAVAPQPIALGPVRLPLMSLSGVYVNYDDGTIRVKYTGELSITDVSVYVNGVPVKVLWFSEREVVLQPPLELLGEAFELHKPLQITVEARLNMIGKLSGNYTTLVGGWDLQVSPVDGLLYVRNPNCFPVSARVSIRYSYGGEWMWLNRTMVVDGRSQVVVEPPEGSRYAYAYVYWLNQGVERWVGVPLRRG